MNGTIREQAIKAICGNGQPQTATQINLVNLLTEFGEQITNSMGAENAFLMGVLTDLANEFMLSKDGLFVYPQNPFLAENVNLAIPL